MKKDFENVIYCFAENIIMPKSPKENTGKWNPLTINARTQLGLIDFKFWLPDDLGVVYNEINTSPIKLNDFFKVEVVNLEKGMNEYKTKDHITLQGEYKSFFKYSIIDKSDVPSDLINKVYKDRSVQIKNAKEFLLNGTDWNDKKVGEFVKKTIANNPKFLDYPAALSNHHAYKGGLLIHTYEVAYLSQSKAENLKHINPGLEIDTDALVCAAWLHDIGKVEIYEEKDNRYIPALCEWAYPTNKRTSSKDETSTHIVRSYDIFKSSVKSYEFKDEFIEKVGHCILAHQGRKEWDSPVEPKCLEALILSNSDKESADAAKLE